MSSRLHSKAIFLVMASLLLGSIGGIMWLRDRRTDQVQQEATRRDAVAALGPKVRVVPVTTSPGERTVTLPGSVRAAQQAVLAAKVAGYLKTVAVDKGDPVKRGQVLAMLESPETDQQVIAAEAELALRQREVERVRKLAPSGFSTPQQVDSAETDWKAAQATLAQLRALQKYQTIYAPFDGVVNVRYLDPGSLVQAGAAVLEVVDLTYTKVVVDVGQDAAPFLRVGDTVQVVQDERSDLALQASVTRLAPTLNSALRTMSAEVKLDPGKNQLQPGSFVRVSLHVKVPSLPIIPLDAVIARGDQLMTAMVKGDRISVVPIVAGPSDGTMLQVRSGLKGGDLVAVSLPVELGDQSRIQPIVKPPAAASAKPDARPGAAPTAKPGVAPAASAKVIPAATAPRADSGGR